MAFMTGFFLLNEHYTSPEKRREIIEYLKSLGFEVYDIGLERFIVFYVEGPSIPEVEKTVKAAESHPGIVKAYIAFGFVGDKAKEEELDRMLESGELELDQSMVDYIKWILSRVGALDKR